VLLRKAEEDYLTISNFARVLVLKSNTDKMNKGGYTFFGLIIGAAFGALFGILYAPDKGKNTRDKLSYRLDKARKNLSDVIEDLVEGRAAPTSHAQEKGQQVISEVIDKAKQVHDDLDELISQINSTRKS
jgi:gas vesicle protein